MAFHSKGNSISRSARTSRRDKESILGLSGWLFADLLLAIAVIFLVVQDKPAIGPQPKCDAACYANLMKTIDDQKKEIGDLRSGDGGLIANAEEQLTITIPRAVSSRKSFLSGLGSSQIRLGKEKKTFTELRDENYKIGFVIWFARDTRTSNLTFDRSFGDFIQKLHTLGLVSEIQFKKDDPENFPALPGYENSDLGNDVFLRIFLFKQNPQDPE